VGTLHVVATPIGNLEDVTLRALRVLREADLLLAEDTRRTRVLLDRHGIAARPRSLHAHNESARIDEVLAALAAGRAVALVSDAGTPLVSDPGGRLLAAALAAGHEVSPVPGPSAALAALLVSGLAPTPFAFLGFLPRRPGARREALTRWRGRPETLVLFESPRRVGATAREAAELLGDRPACVARELTKLHEEVVRAPLSALAERFADGARGEVTLVIGGGAPETTAPEALDARIRARLAAGQGPREIAAALAPEAGLPRRVLYARATALRAETAAR
jgi:16S rRNA (cytidine1402-2'-O)-methyltransferase